MGKTASKVLDSRWSLRPVLLWLQLFGIQLEPTRKAGAIESYVKLAFRCLAFFYMIASRIYITMETTNSLVFNSALKAEGVAIGMTSTQLWSSELQRLQTALAAIGIYSSAFVISFSRWKELWTCIRQMERAMKYQKTYYVQLRRVCFVGMLLLFLVGSITQPLTHYILKWLTISID